MMYTLASIVVFIIIFISIHNLNKKVDYLKKELNKLNYPNEASVAKEEKSQIRKEIEAFEMPNAKASSNVVYAPPSPPKVVVQKTNLVGDIKKTAKPKSEFWIRLEKLFAGNAMGVVGIAAVVVGIVFLAIYAAISMGPIARFVVVCAFSIFFYVVYILLNRYKFWEDMSLWFRSASGVIFLIGCIGSSQFTYMKWVDGFYFSWLLILLGIAVNIVFGLLNKKQEFATVHIVLSLLALLLVPFSYISFVIAAFLSFIGLLVSLGNKKWHVHNAIVNIAFMFANLIWSMNSFATWPASSLPTIALCLFVGLPCLLSHYRKIYQEWDNKALVSHLIIWLTIGINLMLHAKGSLFGTLGLGFGTIATFALSYCAYKMKIDWLFTCDRMVSLVLGILTCISFYKFDISYYQMAFFASIFSIIFLKLNTKMSNKLVFSITNIVSCSCNFIFLFIMFFHTTSSNKIDYEMLIYLIFSFVIVIAFFPSLERYATQDEAGFVLNNDEKTSYTTFLAPFLSAHLVVFTLLTTANPANLQLWLILPLIMGGALIYLKAWQKNYITDNSVYFATILTSLIYIYQIYFKEHSLLINLEMLFVVLSFGVLNLKFSWFEKIKEKITTHSICIIWLVLMVAGYKLTLGISSLLPNVLWLSIFILMSDIKELPWSNPNPETKYHKPSLVMTRLAKATFIVFVLRFALVDIADYTLVLDAIPTRYLTEVFSLLALFYWMYSGTKSQNKRVIRNINDFLELFLLMLLFYIFVEVKIANQGICISILALASLFIGNKLLSYNRLTIYSYVLFFIGLFNVGLVSSSVATPSFAIFDQTWVKGLVSIAISIAFALYGSTKLSYISKNEIITSNNFSKYMKDFLVKQNARVIVYPLFLAIAFFLYNTFDKSILSVLLMLECFVLFMISIISRKSEFRRVAMLSVALLFFRIMFFDLRGQDFLVKAIVFIVIGSILIVMNAIYSKYKYRYEK